MPGRKPLWHQLLAPHPDKPLQRVSIPFAAPASPAIEVPVHAHADLPELRRFRGTLYQASHLWRRLPLCLFCGVGFQPAQSPSS